MLISGPVEWSEALLATGVKANLLQNGYNPVLRVSAMSLGPSVAITRYADNDATARFSAGVLNQPTDTLVLHEGSTTSFRLVAWSRGSGDKSLLAIASTTTVEIWEVTVASDISASLKGSVPSNNCQGLAWNPRDDMLLVYSKTDVHMIDASQPAFSYRAIHTDTSIRQTWGACSWSPCGLHFSLAQNHLLHGFGWKNIDSLRTELPKHDQIDISSSLQGGKEIRLEVGNASFGPIAAITRISSSACIITTDTKLILEDIPRLNSAKNFNLRRTIPNETGVSSQLLLHSKDSQRVQIREEAVRTSRDVIDLTSIRVSASSTQSSLQILNRIEVRTSSQFELIHSFSSSTCQDTIQRQRPPRKTPRSHLLIVECKAGKWSVTSILDLPHVASPNILVVQEMRAIIGSTLAPHLVVAHLDISDNQEWTASLSCELELPPSHVSRGIFLAERSPFVDVASTEKRESATFFHAAASLESQPIYLSKFKVPRRVQPRPSATPTGSAQEAVAIAADKTPKSAAAESRRSETQDLLELVMTRMTAMQTQLNARFDDVDRRLQQLAARVEQLDGGTRGT